MCALGSVSVCFAFGVGKGAKGADRGGLCPFDLSRRNPLPGMGFSPAWSGEVH